MKAAKRSRQPTRQPSLRDQLGPELMAQVNDALKDAELSEAEARRQAKRASMAEAEVIRLRRLVDALREQLSRRRGIS